LEGGQFRKPVEPQPESLQTREKEEVKVVSLEYCILSVIENAEDKTSVSLIENFSAAMQN